MELNELYIRSGIKLKEKKTSKFMLFLNSFLAFFKINDHFMNYITTINKTIYWPDLDEADFTDPTTFAILIHEDVHRDQYSRYWIFFDIAYLLWPILLPFSLLALLAIWFSLWHLLWLVFLLSVIPIPFTLRARFEAEAFGVQYIIWKECFGYDTESAIDYRASTAFSTSDYYFMSTKTWAKKRITEYVSGKRKTKYKRLALAKEIGNGLAQS